MKFAKFLYTEKLNDIEELENDHNNYRIGMLSAVIFSIFALILRLISIIIPTMDPDAD